MVCSDVANGSSVGYYHAAMDWPPPGMGECFCLLLAPTKTQETEKARPWDLVAGRPRAIVDAAVFGVARS